MNPTIAFIAVLLSGYEHVPSDAELLEGRSQLEVERALVALSADTARPMFVRTRATELLGHFPSELTRARLEQVLDASSEHPSMLMAGLRASSKFEGALGVRITPYLSHPDVHLRETAIVALAQIGERSALEARLVEEENPRLKARIVEALSVR
jgi:HEAT repeat protein